ncbi:Serpin-Z6B [Dichanthelium oligosanthes]|uniref:Serpin-Z6B n=1 Tax=Dichanthelium oligosanthes TaxID=888268 RepID=A0A1E5WF45_9POAL|nr:Serpin-Z6B [Dichanthelium oligosanthes]
MSGGCGTHLIAVHDGFKVLRLPYQAPLGVDSTARYSMCVFLPEARDGLWSLVDEIASIPTFLRDHLPERKVDVNTLRLPRFKISFSSELGGVLRDLGLKGPLDPHPLQRADLSDMADERGSGMPPLKIDGICHKAVIEVNEKGTEVAAVTYTRLEREADPPRKPRETVDFVADHPFAFFVMEEVSAAVVFAACVLDPTQ